MPLHFELVTPEKLVRSESVYMVVVPGTEGDFAAMEGHAPFMATVRSGDLEIYDREGTQPHRIHVEGGFAEINERGLTVLAEEAREGGSGEAAPKQREML